MYKLYRLDVRHAVLDRTAHELLVLQPSAVLWTGRKPLDINEPIDEPIGRGVGVDTPKCASSWRTVCRDS